MIIRTPEQVHNDPDIWLKAAYYIVELDSALRAMGGQAEGNGVRLMTTHEGFLYHETLPNCDTTVDICVNIEGIEGYVTKPSLHEYGEPVTAAELEKFRLKGETIISKIISCAPLVDLEFIDPYPIAS